jgi:hypothetical protein
MAFIRPSFIDNMGYHMGEVYGAIKDQILINLARYFPYWTESTVPKSAFEYQATMLAQMGQVNAETVQILRNGLKGGNAALKNILEQAIMESVKKSFPELLKGVQNGIFNPATIPVLAPNQMQAFQFYYQQAAQKLNLVNTVMLESTRQAYQNTVADIVTRVQAAQVALDVGAGEVVTGVSSWNQAMIHSINRMKENGITGFIDHAGHRWSAEAYTSMDIRTTVANTARAAVWETNQSFGNDLYLVSFHNGARPLCYPWQNKVISANDNAGVTYDLDGNEIIVIRQSDTSYGEPAGLFGINCKHYPTPFIPGVSVIYGQPQDKDENDRVYAESQQQRALERKIREEKRDLLMMKAQGNVPDEVIKAQRAKIRQTDDDIDAFCEKTGRARRQNREGVYTKREFPDPQTYDVTTFERTQKDEIDKYFASKGVQQGYPFGTLTPSEPITPAPKQVKSEPQTEKDFDEQIKRLREKRHDLFQMDNYDKNETDRLLTEILDLEDKKKAFIENAKKEALDASVITTRPTNEQEVLKQFNRFDVTKRTDEQILAQINPNYSEGTRQWTHNCQRTVVAEEMAYRGYDVTAMPRANDAIGSSGTAVWEMNGKWWQDPDLHFVEKRSEFIDTVEKSFSEWGEGSRAIIRVKWQQKFGGNGHFIYARKVNGEIIYSDPQINKFLDIKEMLKKTTTGKEQMWVMRVDNRGVNDNITLAIKNR